MNTAVDLAQQIYRSACAYSKAAFLVNAKAVEQPPRNLDLALPSAVMASLALELYFKAFYYLEKDHEFKINGNYSHDFSRLFDELSDFTKQEINSHFDKLIKNKRDMACVEKLEKASSVSIPRELKSNIDEWKDVFVNMRYIFNPKTRKATPMEFFGEIEQAVLLSIFRLRPQWKP